MSFGAGYLNFTCLVPSEFSCPLILSAWLAQGCFMLLSPSRHELHIGKKQPLFQ